MKTAGRIGKSGATKIVSQGEIERVSARRLQTDELYVGGIFEKFFDQGGVDLFLARTQQHGEVDSPGADDGEINFRDVLEIHEDVIYGRRQIFGLDVHGITILSGNNSVGKQALPHPPSSKELRRVVRPLPRNG